MCGCTSCAIFMRRRRSVRRPRWNACPRRCSYGFTLGSFELWYALGVPQTVERMRSEQCAIPENVERMLASGARGFYEVADRDGEPGTRYFDLNSGGYVELDNRPGVIVLR